MQDGQRIVKVTKIIVTHLMIKKTMTITSLAILVAAISVVTTMTIVQADPTGDFVDINIPTATLTDDNVVVGGGVEYTSTMPVVDAELLFTDGNADLTIDDLNEISINTAGTGVLDGTFFFTGATDGEIDFVDANGDESVQMSELSLGATPGLTVVDGGTATLTASAHPITVDIDGGAETVDIDLTAGSPDTNNIVITISDIQWEIGGLGAIGEFTCASSVGAASAPLFSKDTLQVTVSSVVIGDVIDITCDFVAFHGEIDKVLLETCLSTDLEVKRSMAQTCTFNITYDGAPATIVDTISAGWEENPVVFANDNGECSVDAPKGKNKKDNNKSATGFTCDDVGISADFEVTITTRESPGKGHKLTVFKPTTCSEAFDINSGAKAILLDENGEVVLGTLDDKPIVLDSTDPLSVNVGDNESDTTCEEA